MFMPQLGLRPGMTYFPTKFRSEIWRTPESSKSQGRQGFGSSESFLFQCPISPSHHSLELDWPRIKLRRRWQRCLGFVEFVSRHTGGPLRKWKVCSLYFLAIEPEKKKTCWVLNSFICFLHLCCGNDANLDQDLCRTGLKTATTV